MKSDFQCKRCGRARYGSLTGGSYTRLNGQNGLIEDSDGRCTDCLEKDPTFHVGQRITVAAWWMNGKPVACEVESYCERFDSLDVRPLTGNRHGRYIKVKDAIPEQPNYQSQLTEIHKEPNENTIRKNRGDAGR